LAEGLRRAGHYPWLIEDELRVGRSALEVLQHGLRDSDFVLACLSREALRSGWQEAELRLLVDGLPQERADRLIPVRFEQVELPASLQGRTSIDVLEERWDEGIAKLEDLLREAGGAQPERSRPCGESAQPRDEAWGGMDLSACSPEALQLIRAATIFSPGPLLREWLADTAGMESAEAEKALHELSDKGLLLLDSPGREVTPEQSAVGKLRVELAPDAVERFRKRALLALAQWALGLEETLHPDATAEFDRRRPQAEALLRTIPPSVQPMFWASLAMGLGRILTVQGDDQTGRELLERAVAISEHDPALHPIAIGSLKLLKGLSASLGDYVRAKAYLERAVVIAQALPEKKRAGYLAELLVDLTWLLLERDPLAAKQIAQRALELAESNPDATDADKGWCLFVVALCTRDVEGPAAARPLFEQAFRILETTGLGESLQAAKVLAGLASALLQLGDHDGASASLERALSIERRELGSTHPDVALRLSSLAEIRFAENRLREARELFEQARDLLESRYGPEHKDLGSTLNNLGLTLFRMGDRAGARSCFERAIRLLERMRGPDHPYVASSRAGRLLTLEPGSAESQVEMERVFSTGLTLYQPLQEPGSELLERALVLARSQQAPPAEVSHALSEALRAAEAGGSTRNAARAALLLGAFLGSRGAWESAQEHLERALRLSKQSGDNRLVAEAYRLLGDANLHGSHYEDARLNYAEAIRRYDALGFHRKAAKTRLLLLTMMLQLGRVQDIDSLLPPLHKAVADGFFTDVQERADAELALRLADSLRGPQPQGDTP
jgi:tetratricopeptide (TPR) repeat protein